jgi:hypothetical protein
LDKQLKKAAEEEEKAPAPVQKQELVWFFEENLPLAWAPNKVSDTQPIRWNVKALRHQWRSGAPWQPPAA